jgi:hypothetical protein
VVSATTMSGIEMVHIDLMTKMNWAVFLVIIPEALLMVMTKA